ncbi:autotransporter domain-containing protein [Synechococcus sp. FACHB-909]|uniref:autotransporter family protein n=1 Tax=Synechococcus sp. FACHB-909 TaxID=2692863 RepID=UPI001688D893|nr:autotransporter domain-containing protein [Synechococcus sp. FACHB-909]MBD2720035.1 autotransporter domain-containing protein [Synechococcus sp. FACHB-909]
MASVQDEQLDQPIGQRIGHPGASHDNRKAPDRRRGWQALIKDTAPGALALLVASAFLSPVEPAAAAPLEVTFNGTIYTVDLSQCFAPGRILGCNGATDFRQSSWFGNSQLAQSLSAATGDQLGLPNPALGTGLGPNFVWQSGSPAQFNESALPFDGFVWDPVLNISYSRGGSWNSLTGASTYSTVWLAKEVVAPRPLAGPILPGNNGTSVNTTSSLLAGRLLPQFKGGTLAVSASGTTVANNFSLDDSSTNAIDAAGNNATFSGVFADQAGLQGSINFRNSGANGAVVLLSGQSTYQGLTSIWDNATVDIGITNALPTSTELILFGNGRLRLRDNNQTIEALGGAGAIELGAGNLTLNLNAPFTRNSSVDISGSGNLIKDGSYTQVFSGALGHTGQTLINGGSLILNGTSTSDVLIQPNALLGGNGVISANVLNFGTVSPGQQSIGTLTINGGSYLQDTSATLAIDVAGSGQSDLLQLTGSGVGQFLLLEGNLRLTSFQGASITPGMIYTAVTVPLGTVGGDPGLFADTGGVAGTSGFRFVRDEDAAFTLLANGTAVADPDKLQFGWLQLSPTGSVIPTNTPPGIATIAAVKPTGGALTQAITGTIPTLLQQCTANTGNAAACQFNLTVGGSSGANGPNGNSIPTAKALDAGMSSVYAAASQGLRGGFAIPTINGGFSGYSSNQALAAAVTPDFIAVYGALYSLPNRAQLNQALHSITAEPYASMQTVALAALEQFRRQTLSLGDSTQAIRLFTEAEVCRAADGTLIPADRDPRPLDCQPLKIPQASRWSLLIDATNTQASMTGTNDLSSLDYNIFQSSYGLQYDVSRQWSVGANFGYGQANLYNIQYANASISSDTYSGSLWGLYRPSRPWKIKGMVGYTNFQSSANRSINFGSLDRIATASFGGTGFTTALQAEYDWILSADKADRNAVRLRPNATVAYSRYNQAGFSESGAQSLNLSVDGHSADSLVFGIGFTLETPLQLSSSTRLIPRLSLGYAYDTDAGTHPDQEQQLTASFAEVPALGAIDVQGQNRGADDLTVGLNVELETSDQFSLYAGVAGSFRSNVNELSYGCGLRWRFGGPPRAAVAKGGTVAAPAPEPPVPMPSEPVTPTIRGLW